MAVTLPVFLLLLLWIIFHQKGNCWRSALLSASIGWGMVLVVFTELLSLSKLITFNWLLWSWISIDVMAGYLCFSIIRNSKIPPDRNNISIRRYPFLMLLLCGTAVIVGMVGLVAWISPPNNWDSMVYHMSRVVHWQQNHSLEYYPVSSLRQLYQSPWSEFAILHLQILSGGDRLANFVQWFAMIGSIIGVSLIAKQLGADLRGQIFAAVVCAAIPMGIVQGSSTKNDYVVSFWLVCLVYYILSMASGKSSLTNSLAIGSSLGLALVTKGTAYLYALPICIWALVIFIKHQPRKLWQHVLTLASVVVFLNIGQAMRNSQLFDSLLAVGEEKYSNDYFHISVLLSNIIRNISLHLAAPFWSANFTNSVGNTIEAIIGAIHLILGIDVSDPRTTWVGTKFALPRIENLLHEDTAPNLIPLLLAILSIGLLLRLPKLRNHKYLVTYLMVILANFLIFTLLLKWQPWHSRLHLPLFVLSSAFIGTVLSSQTYRRLVNIILVLSILGSVPWLLSNQTRSLTARENIINTSRNDTYFNSRPSMRKPYIGAANFIKSQGCDRVGLAIGNDDWEYPLWVLMHDNRKPVQIEHVDVTNVSSKASKYTERAFIPCAIFDITTNNLQQQVRANRTYIRKWSSDPVSVFMLERARS
jgi:hypothetical protein